MRIPLIILTSILTSENVSASGYIYYGSRVGMEVTVTSVSGLDTNNARITVKHTRENARKFCIEYANDKSDTCIDNVLNEAHLNDEIYGNCKTGKFLTLSGETIIVAGRYKHPDEFGPKYRLILNEHELDASSASGYSTFLGQYKALCPSSVLGGIE